MKIICVGDSLTYGYPFGEKYSWTGIISGKKGWEMLTWELTERAQERFFRGSESMNTLKTAALKSAAKTRLIKSQ